MATFFSNLFYFFLTSLVLVFITLSSLEFYYNRPGPSVNDQLLAINKGQSVAEVATILRELNLIESRLAFILLSGMKGFHNKLKFGEYLIPKKASIKAIIEKVAGGVSVQYKITIPEGWSTTSVVKLINNDQRIRGDLIDIIDEGILAPNTYSFDITTKKRDLFLKLKNEQKKILADAWINRASDLPLNNADELLTLASIVEKEAGNEEDKKKVASVFLNRLKRKMRLQSDPTVVYGLTSGKMSLNRKLTSADLKIESPFNTYKILGLPPNPICNPSKASIYAVANPIITDLLYFVADGEGGHNFSRDLRQHNVFVKQYRRLQLKIDALE